jgi:hypothetical protein
VNNPDLDLDSFSRTRRLMVITAAALFVFILRDKDVRDLVIFGERIIDTNYNLIIGGLVVLNVYILIMYILRFIEELGDTIRNFSKNTGTGDDLSKVILSLRALGEKLDAIRSKTAGPEITASLKALEEQKEIGRLLGDMKMKLDAARRTISYHRLASLDIGRLILMRLVIMEFTIPLVFSCSTLAYAIYNRSMWWP